MDLFEAIKNRRSIRSFTNVSVPDKDIEKILNAAIMAPSAGNRQPWNFIVIKDDATKKALAVAALSQNFIIESPVVIAVCANIRNQERYGQRGMELYRLQDTAAAIQNMLLSIHALGYGAVWVGAFSERKVCEILSIPDNIKIVALIPIGKPSRTTEASEILTPPRLPLEEIVYHDKFGNK
ncbi:MAG: nitroreductase family protein [Candidatus Zixiibacteriota bacterium]